MCGCALEAYWFVHMPVRVWLETFVAYHKCVINWSPPPLSSEGVFISKSKASWTPLSNHSCFGLFEFILLK